MEKRGSFKVGQRLYVRPTIRSAQTMFLGVDVGTLSARAGVFDEEGHLISSASCPMQIWKEAGCVEQSSTDIWHAICSAVTSACRLAGVRREDIRGIGFDATCSLVAVDSDGEPVTVSRSNDSRRNVIVWMDHRAVEQADRINMLKAPALQFVGGQISPEMQPPKLLWVKENLPDSWTLTARWMDLGDWITFRATGSDTRSLCTTVCKWTYLGHAHGVQLTEDKSSAMDAIGWDDLFWQEIGLEDLVDGGYAKIGCSVALPGHPLGSGLSAKAAQELGLLPGTPVSTALIDAHAGGLGAIGGVPPNLRPARSLTSILSDPVSSTSGNKGGNGNGNRNGNEGNGDSNGGNKDRNRGGGDGNGVDVGDLGDISGDGATGRAGRGSGERQMSGGEGTSNRVDQGEVGSGSSGDAAQDQSKQWGRSGEVVWDSENESGSSWKGARAQLDDEIAEEPLEEKEDAILKRMVLVCGTSSCHMAVSKEKLFVPGVWGPYWSAMVPGFWLTEGGQSATGALLDHLINGHMAAPHLANRAAASRSTISDVLNNILERLAGEKGAPFGAALTANIHVLPDFHGNRSPYADPHSKGVIYGLDLDNSEEGLALLYLATIQGIAYGTRQIIQQCNAHGHQINTIVACGGLARNRVYLQEHADVTGCNIVLPREAEPVLLGSAVLGAMAAGRYSTVSEAMKAMTAPGLVLRPSENPCLRRYHETKFAVFQSLHESQTKYRHDMAAVLAK